MKKSLNLLKKLLIILIAILFSKVTFAQSNSGEDNPEHILYQDEPEGVAVCGHDADYLLEQHQKYQNFKQNGHTPDNGLKAPSAFDPGGTLACGKFRVYYDDYDTDYGFFDPMLGAARRSTFCAVLNYIEERLEINTNSGLIEVLVQQSATTSPGWLARAGSYFQTGFGSVSGIYNGHTFNHITTGVDPDPDFFDCHVQVNFGEINGTQIYYFDDYTFTPLNQKYDLFTVLLHEMTHALGFHSMVVDTEDENNDVICSNTGNSFTNYDWTFGYFGDITNPSTFDGNKLVVGTLTEPVINTSVNAFDAPLRTYNVWINDEGAPNNHAMSGWYDTSPDNPPSLSHWGLGIYFTNAGQHSPGWQPKHVMSRSIMYQELKREWTYGEFRALLELGYSLNPIFANSNSMNGTESNYNLLLNNSPAYRSDYETAYSGQFTEELLEPDYVITNSNGTTLTHVVADTDVIDDESDVISIMENTLFGIRGVSDGGNNHNRLTINSAGTEVVYTPEPGFVGRAQFGYYLWDGHERGAMEIITIEVLADPEFIVPIGDELVINGSYEDATEVWTQDNLDSPYHSSNFFRQENYNFGSTLAGGHHFATRNNNWFPVGRGIFTNKSHDSYLNVFTSFDVIMGVENSWTSNCPGNYHPHPDSSIPNNLRYSRLSTLPAYSTLKNNFIAEASEQDWHYYTFSCDVSFDNGDFTPGDTRELTLQIIGEPVFPFEDIQVYQTITNSVIIDEVSNNAYNQYIGSEVWQTVNFNFYYCGDLDTRYIAFSIDTPFGDKCVFDNISIKEQTVETVYDYEVIPQMNGCGASISIWGDNLIEVSWQGPGVDGNSSLELTDLSGGVYTATMNFEGGCSVVEVFEIPDVPPSPPLVITLDNLENEICGSSNGSIEITVTGGSGNYEYYWDNIAISTDDVYNLGAGTYTVTAWDVVGCEEEVTMTFTIEEDNDFEVATTTNADCMGSCDGTATVFSNDGIINLFQLELDGNLIIDTNNDLVIEGLCAGEYNMLVESTNGCVYTDIITIDGTVTTADLVNPVITGNVTWDDTDLVIEGVLFIAPGSQLTIDGITVKFTPGSRVVVAQSGTIRTFGAILTSLCDEFWGGVELRGNPNMPQISAFQATCWINETEISNALVGLRALGSIDNNDDVSQSGGFGRVNNSNFINNVNDIRVSSYVFNTNGYSLNINSCNFIINSNFFDSQLPQERIYIHQVHNLQMIDCSFDNMNPDFLTQTELIAIKSNKASFNLTCGQQQNCNSDPHINGFTRGVFAKSGFAPYYNKIDRMEFNNFRNVYMAFVGQSKITRSNFYNLPTGYYSDDLVIGNIPWADVSNVNYAIYLYPNTQFNIL